MRRNRETFVCLRSRRGIEIRLIVAGVVSKVSALGDAESEVEAE